MVRVQKLMGVDDEIAHMRVIHGGLSLGLPGAAGGGIAGIGADEVELREVPKGYAGHVFQFAPEHQVKKLRLAQRRSPVIRAPSFARDRESIHH